MDNTVLILVVTVVTYLICAGILIVFKRYINRNIVGENGNSGNGSHHNAFKAYNVIDSLRWLGKNAVEAGIDEKYIKLEHGTMSFAVDGYLFGAAAHGEVYFSHGEEIVKQIETVYLHTTELTYDDCKAKLSELYGEAQNEAEEPYAEANGGALKHCNFLSEGCKISLSSASEKENIDLKIERA